MSSSESRGDRSRRSQDASRYSYGDPSRSSDGDSSGGTPRPLYSPPTSPPRKPSYAEANLPSLRPMRGSISSTSSGEGRVKAGELWRDESPRGSPRSVPRSLSDSNAYKSPPPTMLGRNLPLDTNSRKPPLSPPLAISRSTPPQSPVRSSPATPTRQTAPTLPPKSPNRPTVSPRNSAQNIHHPVDSPPSSPNLSAYRTAPSTLSRSKGKQRAASPKIGRWSSSDASGEDGASSSSHTLDEDMVTRGSILFGAPQSPTVTIKQDWPVDVSPDSVSFPRRSQSARPNLEEEAVKVRAKHASMAQILDEQAEAYNEDVPIAQDGLERPRSASPLQRHKRVSSHDQNRTPSFRRRYRRASKSDSIVSTGSAPRLSPPLAINAFDFGNFINKPPSPTIQRRMSSLHGTSPRDSISITSSAPSEAVESMESSNRDSSQYATPESTPSLRPQRVEDLFEALEVETPSIARMEDEKRSRTRARAIQELISTEWTYAQDLAIARDVYYARAQGVPLELISSHLTTSNDFVPPPTPMMQAHGFAPLSPDLRRRSFAPSPALTSTGTFSPRSSVTSGPSAASSAPATPAPPPMAAKDIKTIFLNMPELAEFGSAFSGVLDSAAGSSGQDDLSGEDDRIGEEFLRMMPRIASIYSNYCSRHGTALARLEELEGPLSTYLTECQDVCKSLTHSWSLGSLLIKPVQRCLKYPLLIETILSNTRPLHPDYGNLEAALEKMLAVAQELNEAKRRNDLVSRAVKKKDKSSRDRSRKSNGLTTSISSASFTQTVSKKVRIVPLMNRTEANRAQLLRSGYKVQKAAGIESPSDSDLEEAALLETLTAQLESRRALVDSLGTDIRAWLTGWSLVLHRMRALLAAWIEMYAPLDGEAEIQGGGRDIIRAFLRLVETLEEEVFAKLSFRLHATIFSALDRLDSLFAGPRIVVAKRTVKRIDYERAARHPNDKTAQEGRAAYIALTHTLATELPVFLTSLSRAVDHIVFELSQIQADFYKGKHARLIAFERTYCSKFAGGGDISLAWWQLVQPLHAAIDGLSCTQSTLLMHRIQGERAAVSSWRASKDSDSDFSSVPQRAQSAPGMSLESLLLQTQNEKHQRHHSTAEGVPAKSLKSRRSAFWTRRSSRSPAGTPPGQSPDEFTSIRKFFSNTNGSGSLPTTPVLGSNSSTVSLTQEPTVIRHRARVLRTLSEGLLVDGRPALPARIGDHVAVLWEEGTGWTFARDEATGRTGFVPYDSIAALPAGAG